MLESNRICAEHQANHYAWVPTYSEDHTFDATSHFTQLTASNYWAFNVLEQFICHEFDLVRIHPVHLGKIFIHFGQLCDTQFFLLDFKYLIASFVLSIADAVPLIWRMPAVTTICITAIHQIIHHHHHNHQHPSIAHQIHHCVTVYWAAMQHPHHVIIICITLVQNQWEVFVIIRSQLVLKIYAVTMASIKRIGVNPNTMKVDVILINWWKPNWKNYNHCCGWNWPPFLIVTMLPSTNANHSKENERKRVTYLGFHWMHWFDAINKLLVKIRLWFHYFCKEFWVSILHSFHFWLQ